MQQNIGRDNMSEIRKELGKIKKITFGYGGYQDSMLGFTIDFEGNGWGVSTFIGQWSMEPSKSTKWTKESRDHALGEDCLKIKDYMDKAKVTSLDKLNGKPVEITFKDFNLFSSFRILEEVL